MATATKLISRALRLIGAIDANESMEAATAQDALGVLNDMLAEWHESGVGLPEYSFTSLLDTLSTDAGDSEAISYQLAIRLAPEYGQSLSQEAAVVAEQSMNRLRLRYFQPGRVETDLPSPHRGFNILTGE